MRANILPFAVLLAAAPAAAQQPVPAVAGTGATLLDVVAEGRTTRVPDIATIRAGVVAQAATAQAALADQATRMARVMAALKRAGVAPRDLSTASVQLSPQYRYQDNQPPQVTGYQATNTVSIRFRDVARAGGVLDALVAEGANQIDGPELSIDQPDAALDEARVDAVRRARARATLYAGAAGMKVGRIVSISEQGQSADGPRPPVVYARAMAVEAKTAIAPGERDVTVTVAVRFALD